MCEERNSLFELVEDRGVVLGHRAVIRFAVVGLLMHVVTGLWTLCANTLWPKGVDIMTVRPAHPLPRPGIATTYL